jgi:hypothetical protein
VAWSLAIGILLQGADFLGLTSTKLIIPSDFSNSLIHLNPVLIGRVLISDVSLGLTPLSDHNRSNNMLQYGVN